jgi:hypothetical protein
VGILPKIGRELVAHIRAAGFEPIDEELSGDRKWLEYRRSDATGVVLLSISDTAADRTIAAELWRPARMAEALRAEGPADVAERRRVWQYRTAAEAREVEEAAATVAGWLAELPGPTRARCTEGVSVLRR